MLTAIQFWTPERREKYREAKARGYGKPSRFELSTGAEPGEPVKEGPHKGFRFHSHWPAETVVMEAKNPRKGGDKEAARHLDHHGWFTDSFQDGVIYACAVRVRIPRSRGKWADVVDESHGTPTRVRWMEATSHTDWDQILIGRLSRDLHDSLADCIRSADRVAEMAAEEAREDDMKYQAESQIAEKREEIKATRAQLREALAARREASAPDALCRVLRSWVAERLAEIRSHKARIALLERDPWQAVSW